ncbi:Os10g0568800 [Oryza sativa Japonica Group]|uniref:Os10g0568800 protein n=1 Tax=Oryza sativa subsp. japonica TaxID=39947 RepID=A0A0P0XXI9_ORYSJ|nr:hypothetical protein EE612_052885 [Oryza sativa]BAT12141.1 Os10g0568800 [Oryza sativa Japonica Group]
MLSTPSIKKTQLIEFEFCPTENQLLSSYLPSEHKTRSFIPLYPLPAYHHYILFNNKGCFGHFHPPLILCWDARIGFYVGQREYNIDAQSYMEYAHYKDIGQIIDSTH